MGYMVAQCTEAFLNSVKQGIGYPIITDEFSFAFKDTDIINLIISPCLETFHNFFPKQKIIDISVGGGVEGFIDAPDNTLGIIHYDFVDNTSGASNLNSGNPFFTASQVSSFTSSYNYGTPFSYGKNLHSYQNVFYNKSMKQMNKVFYVKYNEDEDKIYYKSTLSGILNIIVGVYDPVVANIPKRLQRHFGNYCIGTLMCRFAEIMNLTDTDLPLAINTDDLRDNGIDKIEVEMEYFRNNSTYAIMRG